MARDLSAVTSDVRVVVSPPVPEKSRKESGPVHHSGNPRLLELAPMPAVEHGSATTGAGSVLPAHVALTAHLIETRGTDEPILPDSIPERLAKYAPTLARSVAKLPAERVTVYHGANTTPSLYNPVLVNDMNTYCAADTEELSLAKNYLTGRISGDSLLWRSDEDPDRLTALRKAGHEYYGFLTEFSVPPSFFGSAWEFCDNLMVNDFLFATRIGTYNLNELARAQSPAEEEAALEWYSPSEFLAKFIPAEAHASLLTLKRSKTALRHDYDRFEAIQCNVRNAIAAKGIERVDGLFYTHHEGMGGHDICRLHFRYLDGTGEARTVPLDGSTRITVNGESASFRRKKTAGDAKRLVWTLPDGTRVNIGKRAKVPEVTTNRKTPITFDFGFDDRGNLAISVATGSSER